MLDLILSMNSTIKVTKALISILENVKKIDCKST